jgi:hypothetical protein
MAVFRKVVVGAINITMHPHSPKSYIKLLKSASKNATSVRLRHDLFGRIAHVSERVDQHNEGETIVEGDLYKYIDIDLTGNWYDIDTRDVASDSEKDKINIPEQLKPDLAVFSFVFYPKNHLLVYQAYDTGKKLTPLYAEKIVRESLNSSNLSKKYGVINVTHLPETDKVEEIINLKRITSITLDSRRPNPDDLRNAERKYHDRLKKINAKTEIKTFKADEGESLKPDEELKNEMRIAAKNGDTSVTHIDENDRKSVLTTAQHPLTRTDFFNPETSLFFDVFESLANNIRVKISNWIN